MWCRNGCDFKWGPMATMAFSCFYIIIVSHSIYEFTGVFVPWQMLVRWYQLTSWWFQIFFYVHPENCGFMILFFVTMNEGVLFGHYEPGIFEFQAQIIPGSQPPKTVRCQAYWCDTLLSQLMVSHHGIDPVSWRSHSTPNGFFFCPNK